MAKRVKRFADDGWALWVGGDDTSTFFIDQWVNPVGKSYADVAVSIRGIKGTKYLSVYVPFSVEKHELEDLAEHLADEHVFRAVFNATGLFEMYKNKYTSEMAYHGRLVDLIHIAKTDFTMTPLASGTLIHVPFENLIEHIDNDEAYFFFRIPHKSLDDVLRPFAMSKSSAGGMRSVVASPVLIERYGCSVRINEARLLPPEITSIGSFHRQKLDKAVVSLTLRDDYQLSGSRFDRVHRLEKVLYEKYAPKDFDLEDTIVYHLEQTRHTNLRGHFNFYFDIQRETVSAKSLIVYTFLIFFIGVATNAAYDLICALFS